MRVLLNVSEKATPPGGHVRREYSDAVVEVASLTGVRGPAGEVRLEVTNGANACSDVRGSPRMLADLRPRFANLEGGPLKTLTVRSQPTPAQAAAEERHKHPREQPNHEPGTGGGHCEQHLNCAALVFRRE